MYRRVFLLLAALITLAGGHAQPNTTTSTADLIAKVEQLRALLPARVTAGREEIDQRLDFESATPYLITVSQTEGTSSRTETTVAKVNLALLRRVRVGDGRGLRLPVTVYGEGNNLLVGSEDGSRLRYQNAFDLLAADTDNARALVALIEEILPLAKAAYGAAAAIPADAAGLETFIAERVRPVAAGREDYTQALTFDGAEGTGTLKLTSAGVRSESSDVVFVVADLQDRGLRPEARGGLVTLTLPVRRGREYVQVDEGGEVSFGDEVVLRFGDYGDAQAVSEAFAKLIPLAVEQRRAPGSLPQSTSAAAAVLRAAFAKTSLPDAKQTIAGDCRATVELANAGRITSVETYDFNFADLDPRAIEVRGRRGYVSLVLNTRERDSYVKRTADGAVKGFDRNVELRLSSAPAARDAVAAVEYLAEHCPPAVAETSLADAVQSANVKDFGEGDAEQVLAEADTECGYVLTLGERVGSRTRETQTTFSLRDLDPRSATLKVLGDGVFVGYGSRRGERLIDVVRDGGEQRYEDDVSVRFADVQSAREFMAAFAQAIEGCK